MPESDAESAIETGGRAPGKGVSRTLLISIVLAVLLGGAGFYGVYSGLIPLGGDAGHGGHADTHGGGENGEDGGADDDAHAKWTAKRYETPAFVPLEPFVLSLAQTEGSRHLRVSLTIEVAPGAEDDVVAAIPRINDVLNTYLRAVDQRDFEVPRAMMRLRAQMLRRVRLVSPPDTVRDLLFQEFVLN